MASARFQSETEYLDYLVAHGADAAKLEQARRQLEQCRPAATCDDQRQQQQRHVQRPPHQWLKLQRLGVMLMTVLFVTIAALWLWLAVAQWLAMRR